MFEVTIMGILAGTLATFDPNPVSMAIRVTCGNVLGLIYHVTFFTAIGLTIDMCRYGYYNL